MLAKLKQEVQRITSKATGIDRISASLLAELHDTKMLVGALLANQLRARGRLDSIRDAEFKVFSQFGDDGIIQYLINQIEVPQAQRTFIEFGVENYREANTRFLLMKDNWRGHVIDGSVANIAAIRGDEVFWKHELGARAAFIDKDNINDLLAEAGFGKDIGILSIDIDGNDYWVWDAITVVDPLIVVAEYNSVFGREAALTVPYDPNFRRSKAHASNLYWGASIRALDQVARRKGYVFIGCNSAGNNAYFVRRDMTKNINVPDIEAGYVESRFRESRGSHGELTFLSGRERMLAIRDCHVFDVERQELRTISEVFGMK